MELFRLCREKYIKPLSGIGAAIKGARWNSVGVELIYTASNRSLAMAEVAVHFTMATLPEDYMMVTIFVPDNIKVKTLSETALPNNWKEFPHPPTTQKFGDDFVYENKYCILKVSSVVTKGDFNLLINPNHKDFSKIKITEIVKFPFDKRILK